MNWCALSQTLYSLAVYLHSFLLVKNRQTSLPWWEVNHILALYKGAICVLSPNPGVWAATCRLFWKIQCPPQWHTRIPGQNASFFNISAVCVCVCAHACIHTPFGCISTCLTCGSLRDCWVICLALLWKTGADFNPWVPSPAAGLQGNCSLRWWAWQFKGVVEKQQVFNDFFPLELW